MNAQKMERAFAMFIACGIAASGGAFANHCLAPPPDSGACVEKTRVVTDSEKEWSRCDHPDHQLIERPIGYGRVLVSCTCVKPVSSEPLTPEESATLDKMQDAGERLPDRYDLDGYPRPFGLEDGGAP